MKSITQLILITVVGVLVAGSILFASQDRSDFQTKNISNRAQQVELQSPKQSDTQPLPVAIEITDETESVPQNSNIPPQVVIPDEEETTVILIDTSDNSHTETATAPTQEVPQAITNNYLDCHGKLWLPCEQGVFHCADDGMASCTIEPENTDSPTSGTNDFNNEKTKQAELLLAFSRDALAVIKQEHQDVLAQLAVITTQIDLKEAEYDRIAEQPIPLRFIYGQQAKVAEEINVLIGEYNALLGTHSYSSYLDEYGVNLQFEADTNGGILYSPFGTPHLQFSCNTFGNCFYL